MNLKYLLFYFVLFSMPLSMHGQIHESKRVQKIFPHSSVIQFDTLSILPQTVICYTSGGKVISPDLYSIKGLKASLILKDNFPKEDTIFIHYTALPYNLETTYQHKSIPNLPFDSLYSAHLYQIPKLNKQNEGLFGMNDLKKNGNIARGISIGNTQDMSVASNLNLQLNGQLSPELKIIASISDQNIPVQPEGNTQQIQEFDRVFIQLQHKKGSLTAGDFHIKKPNSFFLNYNKKVQGARVEVLTEKNDTSNSSLKVYAGAALSKGKYAVNQIVAIEGNQGPYKLTGNDQESFIIIIAGSEKVYIDGSQLTRGQSNDYTIDYNTSEVTFTAKQLITKDKRIRIEFEYSDRNYARSMVQTGVDYEHKKFQIHAHYFNESDLKNQSLDQELSLQQQQILASVGDNLNAAIASTIDSVGYFNDRVLYKKIDTLGYPEVYVYSTNQDSAVYQLSFSNVGNGNGNYNQIQSSANGRVFQWIAPSMGVPQGEYEAVAKLISPKKKQMLSLGFGYEIAKGTIIKTEFALSDYDKNLFSALDQADNQGIAFNISLQNTKLLGKQKKWKLKSNSKYEFEQSTFTPIERFRSVEFNRNWNVDQSTLEDQQIGSLLFHLSHKKYGFSSYQLSYLKYGNQESMQNNLQGKLRNDKWKSSYKLALTNNGITTQNRSYFLRHNANIGRSLNTLRLGIKESGEDNRYFLNQQLNAGSFRFQSFQPYIESVDSGRVFYRFQGVYRSDDFVKNGVLSRASIANEAKGEIQLLGKKGNGIKAVVAYRKLEIVDTLLLNNQSDESSTARLEHRLKLFKGAIQATSFYEAGSGMEVRKEYTYLEVAAGQGVYSWADYNGNDVKELDEFEISAFPDEANYIRVNIPTNDYIKTYGNQLSSIVNIRPSKVWKKSTKKYQKFLSKFSNKFNMKVQHKSTDDSWNSILNPFAIDYDSPLLMSLNTSYRNTLYFMRSNPVFGGELSLYKNQYRTLLTNGFESQEQEAFKSYLRYNINAAFMVSLRTEIKSKSHSSEYFMQRNYDYSGQKFQPEISMQISRKYRIRLQYQYSEKSNPSLLNEQCYIHKTSLFFKYNQPQKGSWNGNVNYLLVNYNANDKTPIAYEMLEGFRNGTNYSWNVNYMRTVLKNMQLSIGYTGRASEETEIIHVGNVMLRAFF